MRPPRAFDRAQATPHRVARTAHARSSIIRFNGLAPDSLVQPHPSFVSAARPAAYSPVLMRVHLETSMRNIAAGRGAWDAASQTSTTSTYRYDRADQVPPDVIGG